MVKEIKVEAMQRKSLRQRGREFERDRRRRLWGPRVTSHFLFQCLREQRTIGER